MKYIIPFVFVLLFLSKAQQIYSQPFQVCDGPGQNSCQCSTAPVICSVEELNGYNFQMSSYQHASDGPNPLCPPPNTNVPNNPTWVAFIAWCTDLTIKLNYNSCTWAGVPPSRGLQAVVYADCNNLPGSVVSGGCSANCPGGFLPPSMGTKTLNLTGLMPGETYYLLVDGCSGSACNVTIEVIGECSLTVGDIEETEGPSEVCLGTSATYSIDPVIGAELYYWYLNGVNISDSEDPSVTIPFTSPGEYELCVDISNVPCLEESADPPQSCYTILVLPEQADAGDISVITSPSCPGETINFNVENFLEATDFTEKVFITNEAGIILQIFDGASGSWTSQECATFRIYSYNYTGSSIVPSLGMDANTIMCDDCFCDVKYEELIFEDEEAPVFTDLPASEEVTCFDLIPPPVMLAWTDNCKPDSSVDPVVDNQFENCSGGTSTRTWTVTDACNNTTVHTQVITILPVPTASFTPVADVTLNCDEYDAFNFEQENSYTNNADGDCLITGSQLPTLNTSGFANCQGTIIVTWTATDICARPITEVQQITVNPPPVAAFLDVPDYAPVACADALSFSPPVLDYSNNSDDCPVEGMSNAPQVVNNFTSCGGNINITWNALDECNRNITANRTLEVQPADPPQFTGTLPEDITIACGPVTAYAVNLNYSNQNPGLCAIEGSVAPVVVQNITACGGSALLSWNNPVQCNFPTLTHSQEITVEPSPEPYFLNLPPEDITVSCLNVPTSPPALNYTNGLTGLCGINGSIVPNVLGTYDACGGVLVYDYSFTDACGRYISFTQTVNVSPAPAPAFTGVPLPSPVYLPCDEGYPVPPNLNYTNGLTGTCGIEGSVVPTFIEYSDYREYTWSFTNSCTGQEVSVSQDVYLSPVPEASVFPVETEICKEASFDLSELDIDAVNGTTFTYTYFLGTNPGPQNQLFSPVVSPVNNTIYTIRVTNEFGCFDDVVFSILIVPDDLAGVGTSIQFCNGTEFEVNLFSFLTGTQDFTGAWVDQAGSGVDLSDPYNVPFVDVANGTYPFEYTVTSPQGCSQIPAILTISLLDAPQYEIVSVSCTPDLSKYSITLVSVGYVITTTGGSIVPGSNDTISITNITAGQDIDISFTSQVTGCADDFLPFTAPDCNCPFIPLPASGGNKKTCMGSPVPPLTVSLAANQVALWYTSATGGAPIAENGGSYVPTVSGPGNYTFFAESLDTISDCPGILRIPVSLMVSPLLNLVSDTIRVCDNNHNPGYSFGRIQVKNSFYLKNNLPPFLKFELYNSLADAQSNSNKLMGDSILITGSGTIYFAVTSQDDCTSFASMYLVVYPKPKVIAENINRPVCIGESNGSVVFTLGGGEQINFSGGGFSSQKNYTGLKAGTYKVGIRNALGCIDSTSIAVGEGLRLVIDDFQFVCSNNGTLLNKGDDFYTYTFVINNTYNKAGSVQISYLSNNIGTYAYGQPVSFTLPADGSTGDLIVKDLETGCLLSRKIGPLESCSFPCAITAIDLVISDCDNNGTNNTGDDDYFDVNLTPVLNGAAGTAYRVIVNGVQTDIKPYNIPITLILKANGASQSVQLQDTTNTECVLDLNYQKAPCSKCEQTIEAGSNALFTCLNKNAQLNAIATSGGIIEWTGPGNFKKQENPITVSIPGTYYATATYPDQCVVKDSVLVSIDAGLPFAFAGQDQLLDCKNKEVTLTGQSNLTSNASLFWTNEAGNVVGNSLNLQVSVPGVYFFEVVNNTNNCRSDKDTVTVIQNIKIPEAVIIADPGNLLDCKVLQITLAAKDVPDAQFNWQTGEAFFSNTRSIQVANEGVVRLFVIDTLNGCEGISLIDIVDIQDYPILSVGDPLPITCLNNGTYISAAGSPQGPNLVYTWYDEKRQEIPGVTGDSLFVTVPGNYYVVLTDTTNNCSNSDTILVNRLGEFPMVMVPADVTLYCGEMQTQLKGQVQSPVSPVTIQWKTDNGKILNNSSESAINIEGEGVYTMEVTYNDSGCKTTEQVSVEIDTDFPKAILAEVTNETCTGKRDGAIFVENITGGKAPYLYSLNGASFSGIRNFAPLNPGTYRLAITDANGCKKDSTIVIEEGSDISLSTISPLEIIYNQSKTLEVKTNLTDAEIKSVKWTPADQLSCNDCLVTTIQPTEDKWYEVVVTDIYGCEASATVVIRVKDNSMITVPNIINPNGSSNKYLVIYGNENVFNVESLTVYDRWGNLIFTKQNFKPNAVQEGWDGTMVGKPVAPGVYVYKVDYLSPSGIRTITGDVTVIN